MEMQSSQSPSEPMYFHCPKTVCSSGAQLMEFLYDQTANRVFCKLVCDLGHSYWVAPGELVMIHPYWPVGQRTLD